MSNPRLRLWLLTALASLILLITSNVPTRAQTFEPATSGFAAEIKVWTSGGSTYAKVRLTFPNLGFMVSDWGSVTRSGNSFTADAKVERYTGASGQAIMFKENTYSLGQLQPGTYTFTFKSYGVALKSQQFDPTQVEERWEPATASFDRVGVGIRVITNGDTRILKVEFYFPDTGYAVTDWGPITRTGNDFTVDVKVDHWTGESAATTVYVDHDYQMGVLAPGSYNIIIKIYGTVVRTQPFTVNAAAPRLLTEGNSKRAIALDSVTWLRLFPLISPYNYSPDRRARIMLLVADVDWSSEVNLSAVTVQAEDAQHKVYPLTVEYVGKVPNFDWLTQVIVKPPEELKNGGDVWLTVSVRGATSNRGMVTIKPSDAGAQ